MNGAQTISASKSPAIRNGQDMGRIYLCHAFLSVSEMNFKAFVQRFRGTVLWEARANTEALAVFFDHRNLARKPSRNPAVDIRSAPHGQHQDVEGPMQFQPIDDDGCGEESHSRPFVTKRATGPRSTALQRCPVPFRVAAVDDRPSPFVGMESLHPQRLAVTVRLHRRADGTRCQIHT